MARTFSNPTVARALDAAMFLTPTGMPATAFKRELECRLMHECQFNSGRVPPRNLDKVRVGSWAEHQFFVGISHKGKG